MSIKEKTLLLDEVKTRSFFGGQKGILVENISDKEVPIILETLNIFEEKDPFLILTAGFLNHHLANGFVNGVACADFYWSVSLMFSLSNSVLPVTIYHTLSTRSGADLSWHTQR